MSSKENLYISTVGKNGKQYLEKTIRSFGTDTFDYLIIVFDDTTFEEDIFKSCKFIYEKGYRWHLITKYAMDVDVNYKRIFAWPDDIDVEGFSVTNYIDIMDQYGLEMSQPALTEDSYVGHPITAHRKKCILRFTNFVEIMIPVFDRISWIKFIGRVNEFLTDSGWGHDFLAESHCGFTKMAIVDAEPVIHTRPIQRFGDEKRNNELKMTLDHFSDYKVAKMKNYKEIYYT